MSLKQRRRFFTLLLAAAMCLTVITPALAAGSSDTAAIIRLTESEGRVSVANGSGHSITMRKAMLLNNGYRISTEQKSYVWFTLDEDRVDKLDALSETEIRKSGKQLELLLKSGKLFFNVARPLDSGESLNIRTGTMVMGIRGTCGWVEVIDQWTTRAYILEGTVECVVTDAVSGQEKSTTLSGGEMADFVVYEQERNGDKCDIIKEKYVEEDVPGFVLTEVVENETLCVAILDDSGLDLRELTAEDAQERLARDETELEAQVRYIEDVGKGTAVEDVPGESAGDPDAVESQKPVWTQPDPDPAPTTTAGTDAGLSDPTWDNSGTGGSTAGGSTAGETTPGGSTSLTMPVTAAQVQAALNSYQNVDVTGSGELTVDTPLTVPTDSTLSLGDDVNLIVAQSQNLSVNGTLSTSRMTNNGVTTVTSLNSLHILTSLYNDGTGTLIANGGRICIGEQDLSAGTTSPSLINYGTILLENFSDMELTQASTMDNYGAVTLNDSFLTLADNSTLNNNATVNLDKGANNNGSQLSILYGTLDNQSGGQVVMAGKTNGDSWGSIFYEAAGSAARISESFSGTITVAADGTTSNSEYYTASVTDSNLRISGSGSCLFQKGTSLRDYSSLYLEGKETETAVGKTYPDGSISVSMKDSLGHVVPFSSVEFSYDPLTGEISFLTAREVTGDIVIDAAAAEGWPVYAVINGEAPIYRFSIRKGLALNASYRTPLYLYGGGASVTSVTVTMGNEALTEGTDFEFQLAQTCVVFTSSKPATGEIVVTAGAAEEGNVAVSVTGDVLRVSPGSIGKNILLTGEKLRIYDNSGTAQGLSFISINSVTVNGTALSPDDYTFDILGQELTFTKTGLTAGGDIVIDAALEQGAYVGVPSSNNDIPGYCPGVTPRVLRRNSSLQGVTVTLTDPFTGSSPAPIIPPSIDSIRVDGQELSNTDYSYDNSTGAITFSTDRTVTDDVSIFFPDGAFAPNTGTVSVTTDNADIAAWPAHYRPGYPLSGQAISFHAVNDPDRNPEYPTFVTSVTVGDTALTAAQYSYDATNGRLTFSSGVTASGAIAIGISMEGFRVSIEPASPEQAVSPTPMTSPTAFASGVSLTGQTVSIIDSFSGYIIDTLDVASIRVGGTTLTSDQYMYNYGIINFTGADLSADGDIVITYTPRQDRTAELTVTDNRLVVSTDGVDTITKVQKGTVLEQLYLRVPESAYGLCLPESLTSVTMGDTPLTAGTDYTYEPDITWGRITFGNRITVSGDIEIDASAVEYVNISIGLTGAATDSNSPAPYPSPSYLKKGSTLDGQTITLMESNTMSVSTRFEPTDVMINVGNEWQPLEFIYGSGVITFAGNGGKTADGGIAVTLELAGSGSGTDSGSGTSPTSRQVFAANAPGFSDVPANAWYAKAVDYCAQAGIMGGTGGDSFSPNISMNRGMVVTVLYRLAGSPPSKKASPFSDVPDWCADAVAWAAETGITNGSGDGLFGTADPVTREQIATFLWRYAGSPVVKNVMDFNDAASISPYAKEAVNWVRSRGIMSGRGGGIFAPRGTASRAEAAMILMNYDSARQSMGATCAPNGIALLKDGTLLVTDTGNKVIWQVDAGSTAVYAGGETVLDIYGAPVGGYHDSTLERSTFKTPWAVIPFLDGWAVSDADNNVVRLVRETGVETINGHTKENLTVTDMGVAYNHPTGLAVDDKGNLYVADTFNGAVRMISTAGLVTTVCKDLNDPTGLCWHDGALYIAETGAHRIVKLENKKLTVVAGTGVEGFEDGAAANAMFSYPQGVAVGPDGTVYVSDTANGAVRRIRNGMVDTVVRRDWSKLEFYPVSPVGLLVRDGQLFVCDNFSRKVLILPLD